MAIVVNNRSIPIPSSTLDEFISKNINLNEMKFWTTRAYPGLALSATTWPTGYSPPGPVRLCELHWPMSRASAWAYMYIVLDADTFNALHDEVYGRDGKEYNSVRLKMSSYTDADETLSTKMYMLAPTPLNGLMTGGVSSPGGGLYPPAGDEPTNNNYIVPLVDERFWYWQIPYLPLDVETDTTWSDVLSKINESLNPYGFGPITMDSVASEYLNPSTEFNLAYAPVAPIIDALAFNVNMRYTRSFDGSAKIMKKSTAEDVVTSDFPSGGPRVLRAGGDSFPTALPYP